jgi:hypothetical protein
MHFSQDLCFIVSSNPINSKGQQGNKKILPGGGEFFIA